MNNAKKVHSEDNPTNIKTLTDLQHYGAKTNLIDFSLNFHIALFFACQYKEEEKTSLDGCLYILKRPEEKKDIDIEKGLEGY